MAVHIKEQEAGSLIQEACRGGRAAGEQCHKGGGGGGGVQRRDWVERGAFLVANTLNVTPAVLFLDGPTFGLEASERDALVKDAAVCFLALRTPLARQIAAGGVARTGGQWCENTS